MTSIELCNYSHYVQRGEEIKLECKLNTAKCKSINGMLKLDKKERNQENQLISRWSDRQVILSLGETFRQL